MIDKPISRQITHAVGEAHGALAAWIVLDVLQGVYEGFAEEMTELEMPDHAYTYLMAAGWLEAWKEEIERDNG
jgi:hypothetical protein